VFGLGFGTRPAAGYVGVVLTLFFLWLFSAVVSLLGSVLGARANTRRRQAVLAVLLALGLVLLLSLGRDLFALDGKELLRRVEASPVLQTALAPLDWFVRSATAQVLWPDLVEYTGLALAVDAAMVLVVLALDAHYLEASAAASERIYARLQRARRGGGVFGAWRGSGESPRFSLPSLPWWGGVGPTTWRQAVTAVRSLRGLLLFLLIFGGVLVTTPLALSLGGDRPSQPAVGGLLAVALLGVSLVSLPTMMPFDFRGDLDRMDLLKSLPVAPWRLAVGQLLAPVALLGAIQLGALACIQALWGGAAVLLLYTVILAWPLDFLVFGIDNLLFLWFPNRQLVATPGDFQFMGRQLLMLLAKFVALGVPAVVAVVAGGVVYFLSRQHWAAALAAALVLTGFAVPLVPALAFAFRSFDVSRDMPP
jgi:Putative ABC exporter